MSARHDEAFGAIRREHADVIAALQKASKATRRGAPGAPHFDPGRLAAAIGTAGDAYALLAIAAAEAFLREYLLAMPVGIGNEPKLGNLIDKAVKECNTRGRGILIRHEDKSPFHDLRVMRNTYAHGHRTGVFPTVPKVEAMLCKFFHPIP